MKSIKKSKMKDEIRVNIQNAIFSGELKPGDRIVEMRLAADMGVSQAPVREALKELEHVGLVESIPYQGTHVKNLTQKDLQDAYDARLVLELYTIELAAEKIAPEQLSSIKDWLDKMNEAATQGNIDQFVKYDIDFHESIIKASGNEMIVKLWELTNIALWTYFTTHLSQRSLENLAVRHTDIYDALSAHHAESAIEAMRVHLVELRDEMTEQFK